MRKTVTYPAGDPEFLLRRLLSLPVSRELVDGICGASIVCVAVGVAVMGVGCTARAPGVVGGERPMGSGRMANRGLIAQRGRMRFEWAGATGYIHR